ncbi:MAG: hemerythrin domain-containing protein [Paracoccaceae bacterium]
MEFSRRTAQLLHEDHRDTIAIVEMLEDMIAQTKRATPDVGDGSVRRTLEKTSTMVAHEVSHHFGFEEDELFTRLADAGDVGIGEHLREEHRVILPLGEQVAALAGQALANGFTGQSWAEFRSLAGELAERMLTHIQKEEMALLPMLDELLDPETDMQLSETYASAQ